MARVQAAIFSCLQLIPPEMCTLQQLLLQLRAGRRRLVQQSPTLYLQVPEDRVQQVCSTVRQVMEGAMQLRLDSLDLEVPLKVKCRVGPNWGTLTEVQCIP